MYYSILPAGVALYFLLVGILVWFKFSKHRTHVAFAIICATTFAWQFTWAILFQVDDPQLAYLLVKLGYLLILFLPTSIYHFLAEMSLADKEHQYVRLSYGLAAILAVALLTSDEFVSGYYDYFFGYYPKAGILHPLHVLQTVVVTMRGLFIVYKKQRQVSGLFQSQLRYCLVSLLVYTFAAVDYLCNYGFEFYPPGIFFITVSLSILLYALFKKELMTNISLELSKEHQQELQLVRAMAGNIAHELRTPLATIQLDVQGTQQLTTPIQNNIINTLQRANVAIDMLLANVHTDQIDDSDFRLHSMGSCVKKALMDYPFHQGENEKVTFKNHYDFAFHGSETMMIYVIFNLLKNALYFVSQAMKGHIEIRLEADDTMNTLYFKDTGTGIEEAHLPHIFNEFYSSKPNGSGNGLGLGFCDRVMKSFGGSIDVRSEKGQYTEFLLAFPKEHES